jgi:transcriptional regulator with XRE-family HTH domain
MLRVRLERQKRGWTLQRVSALTGITSADISQIERGNRPAYPGWRRRIAKAFSRSEEFLFERVQPEAAAAGQERVA